MSQNYTKYLRQERRRPRSVQFRASVDTAFRGKRFQPTLMPSQFTSQPWNNATIRIKLTQAQLSAAANYLQSATIIDIAQKQLGLIADTKALSIEFRIQKFSAWAIGGEALRILPIDFVNGASTSELIVLDSMAQKNMYACVGYQYPMSHQVKVINSAKTSINIMYIESDNTVEIHLNVLWRPSNQGKLISGYEYVNPSSRKKATINVEIIEGKIKEIQEIFQEINISALFNRANEEELSSPEPSCSNENASVRRSQRIASRTSSFEELNQN